LYFSGYYECTFPDYVFVIVDAVGRKFHYFWYYTPGYVFVIVDAVG